MSKDSTGLVTGFEVSRMIKDFKYPIKIRFYRPWNPFSRVNGYFNPSKDALCIYLNKWNLNRSDRSVANTIIHEAIHVIDYARKDSYFGHGDNSSVGKKETAPWKISEIAVGFY
jgi:hypothetical protein